jgi:transcriptional regulator with XRE-family HTH domain
MTDDVLRRLGIRIRALREQSNISQEALGHLAKLHRTYVGAIERGERNPSVLSLKKIADALKVKMGDLFDE